MYMTIEIDLDLEFAIDIDLQNPQDEATASPASS
jgi:hypothetical protein